ncbi:MAG: signal peptidase II [Haliangiales bacterium]
MPRRWNIFLLVGLVSLVADQATKFWARATLPSMRGANGRDYGIAQPVIENFWDWQLSYNTGSAFSLFGEMSGARVFLSIIGVFAVGVIMYMLHRARDDQSRLIWALGLVAGGAIGNLYDRIAYGMVTDFVVWRYYDARWPTFNVADVALVIGVGLMFIDMTQEARAEAKRGIAEDAPQPKSRGGKSKGGQRRSKR